MPIQSLFSPFLVPTSLLPLPSAPSTLNSPHQHLLSLPFPHAQWEAPALGLEKVNFSTKENKIKPQWIEILMTYSLDAFVHTISKRCEITSVGFRTSMRQTVVDS
jgi:hypothetical protein